MEIDYASIAPYLDTARKIGFIWGTLLTCAAMLIAMIVFRVMRSRELAKESEELERKSEELRMRLVCYEVFREMREHEKREREGYEPSARETPPLE